MNSTMCLDENCDGIVINDICNYCGDNWKMSIEYKEQVKQVEKDDRVVRICGLDIVVKEVHLSGGHFGQAVLEDSEILINKDMA